MGKGQCVTLAQTLTTDIDNVKVPSQLISSSSLFAQMSVSATVSLNLKFSQDCSTNCCTCICSPSSRILMTPQHLKMHQHTMSYQRPFLLFHYSKLVCFFCSLSIFTFHSEAFLLNRKESSNSNYRLFDLLHFC